MPKLTDVTGQTFGRLTVLGIARHGNYPGDHIRWRCRCSCGGEASVTARNLRNGHTKSCGCWRSDNWFIQKETHGESCTRLHRIWAGVKTRCQNPHCKVFPRYGGRGIQLCAEWQQFEPFRDWAEANGYAENLTIDRINNDGHYEPSNCRWASHAVQVRNTRQNRAVIRSDGKRYALVIDAAREMGCGCSTISAACRKKRPYKGYEWRYEK